MTLPNGTAALIPDFSPPPEQGSQFDLNGRRFTLLARLPLPLLERVMVVQEMEGIARLAALLDLLPAFVIPADREDFAAALRSEETPLGTNGLTAMFAWIVEQVTGRPTESPSPSSAG